MDCSPFVLHNAGIFLPTGGSGIRVRGRFGFRMLIFDELHNALACHENARREFLNLGLHLIRKCSIENLHGYTVSGWDRADRTSWTA
ncbi:TniB family NTP-binding protein [Rhodococcoides yunnanense]|uniref:TniB family NTP-binding protein n=1 Tax=Rhodococcoides yunnanense TaxID=278209 RepID=UPI00352FFCD0